MLKTLRGIALTLTTALGLILVGASLPISWNLATGLLATVSRSAYGAGY